MGRGQDLWLWLIPALPLAGSALCGVLHFMTLAARTKKSDADAHASPADPHAPSRGPGVSRFASTVAVLAMAVAFALAILGWRQLASGPENALESPAWSWIHTGVFAIDISIVLDHLSCVMALVVTGVGLLIHVYAAGYMRGDPGYAKFFAFLNLFVFAMLMLVLSSSLLGLFIGWEGVGLCSYLLIGFWYEKGWPAEAGQKAFVMNRIGDACFLLGTFILAKVFGTLDLATITNNVANQLHGGDLQLLVLSGFLLFGGACGKSAQLPLLTWLPDAMAGPTPVSALIHAATMVTAGVYLLVRLNPLFAASQELMLFVAIVGAATAFIAGTSALQQRDIKKVLAYSTVSQLGFMFLALGSGAWAAAIFHLVTHAFFKALLFLGAGSVIHGLHDQQDMHKMGNLRAHMPRTFITFLCGAAALSGLPLMSGFFSKDEILAGAYAQGGIHRALWGAGVLTAAITAFYTWRMVALTFFGRARFDEQRVHPHESPAVMTVPLVILAVLSLIGGALGLPAVMHAPHVLAGWLAPVTETGDAILASHARGVEHELSPALEWTLLILGALVALFFARSGFRAYQSGPKLDEDFAKARPEAARFLGDAWGIDRAYTHFIVQPLKLLAFVIAVVVDQFAIDGLVNGAAALAQSFGARSRRMADGSIATYGLWMGAFAALIAFLFLWKIGG